MRALSWDSCSHLQPLEWSQITASSRKWLQVALLGDADDAGGAAEPVFGTEFLMVMLVMLMGCC